MEHVPLTPTAVTDTRSAADESGSSNRREAEKFEFEPCPLASKFGSWKVSFRREVISESTHPRLVSDWLADIDMATGIEDLDHSGFIFDKHQMEIQSPRFQDCQRKHEDYSRRVQEKDQFLGGDSNQEQTSNACGQPNHVSNVLVLEHQEDSGAHDELE